MIGFGLLAIASGAIGWKIHEVVKKKRFESDVQRIQFHLQNCYRLALNTHVDWQIRLEKEVGGLHITSYCPESSLLEPLRPKVLPVSLLNINFNDEEVDGLSFYFTSSGQVYPQGLLIFSLGSPELRKELSIPGIFHQLIGRGDDIATYPED